MWRWCAIAAAFSRYPETWRHVAHFWLAMASGSGSGPPQDTRGSGGDAANGIRRRGGRNYVSNVALGVKRPPVAFHFFLQDMKGSLSKITRRRIVQKQSYFRFDLMKLKYDNLSPGGRRPYTDKVAVAKRQAEELRGMLNVR